MGLETYELTAQHQVAIMCDYLRILCVTFIVLLGCDDTHPVVMEMLIASASCLLLIKRVKIDAQFSNEAALRIHAIQQ